MKTKITFITILISFTLAVTAYAEIPHVMNFQGKATDKNGAPLNGKYEIIFSLYDVAEGGEALWSENWSKDNQDRQIQITNGIFSVALGSINPVELDFDKQYYLGVKIGSDDEMTPRTRFASVGYAYTAEKAAIADNLTVPELPSGVILMWSGAIATIPEGWVLCDGTNGTPDLRDRFIVGATWDDSGIAQTAIKGALLQVGGEHEHQLTEAEMPFHRHWAGGWTYIGPGGFYPPGSEGHSSQYGSMTQPAGGDEPHENCPPFYALAFIMKK